METKSPFLTYEGDDNYFFKSNVLMENGLMMKAYRPHKYIKRTGTSGAYHYWYKTPDGKLVEGPPPDQQSQKGNEKKPDEQKLGAVPQQEQKNQKGNNRQYHIDGLKKWVEQLKIAKDHNNDELVQKGTQNIERVMKEQGIKPEEIGYAPIKAAGQVSGKETQAAITETASEGTDKTPAASDKDGSGKDGENKEASGEEQDDSGGSEENFTQEEWDKTTVPDYKIRYLTNLFSRKKPGMGSHKSIHSLGDLKALIEHTKFAFISAGPNDENPKENKMDPNDSFFHKRHEQMKNDLIQHGYIYTDVLGKYGRKENSFYVMVHDSDREDMIKLGGKYGQQSVAFSDKTKKNEFIRTTPAFEGVDMSDELKKVGAVIGKGDGVEVKTTAGDYYSQFTLPGEKKKMKLMLKVDFLKSLGHLLVERLSLMKRFFKRK